MTLLTSSPAFRYPDGAPMVCGKDRRATRQCHYCKRPATMVCDKYGCARRICGQCRRGVEQADHCRVHAMQQVSE